MACYWSLMLYSFKCYSRAKWFCPTADTKRMQSIWAFRLVLVSPWKSEISIMSCIQGKLMQYWFNFPYILCSFLGWLVIFPTQKCNLVYFWALSNLPRKAYSKNKLHTCRTHPNSQEATDERTLQVARSNTRQTFWWISVPWGLIPSSWTLPLSLAILFTGFFKILPNLSTSVPLKLHPFNLDITSWFLQNSIKPFNFGLVNMYVKSRRRQSERAWRISGFFLN